MRSITRDYIVELNRGMVWYHFILINIIIIIILEMYITSVIKF